MSYTNEQVEKVAIALNADFDTLEDKSAVLKDPRLGELLDAIRTLPPEQRSSYGKEVNMLKTSLADKVKAWEATKNRVAKEPIDVTAPFDINEDGLPSFLDSSLGSRHPLMKELDLVIDIFYRMGFTSIESRLIDDEYHMFDSLNFPKEHPARDEYDTFQTEEGLVAPAHVSVMQNRVLKQFKPDLDKGLPISCMYTGRSFRNEDVDARHEHTFYQVELMYVNEGVNVGNLTATFKAFMEEYYQQKIEVKTQPFYFPFTEPSFEMALSCPFCKKKGCSVCSNSGWIELIGMGIVNPNVLKMGGIDPNRYTGFAGGLGLDRLVMMKYGIEDVRYFHSGDLSFMRQFA